VIGNFHPGAEVFARRIDDDALEVLIAYNAFKQVVDFSHHIDVHHVKLRAVKRNPGNAVSLFKFKMLRFRHGPCSLYSGFRVQGSKAQVLYAEPLNLSFIVHISNLFFTLKYVCTTG